MAYPQVQSGVGHYHENGNTTTPSFVMPTGLSSGDLLLALFTEDGNKGISTGSMPAGWNQIITQASGVYCLSEVWYKISNGSETNFKCTLIGGGSEDIRTDVLRINGWHGTTPPEATAATGTTANPNPPSETASWGSEENLWVAMRGCNSAGGAVSVYPYADNQYDDGAITGGRCWQSYCSDEITAATEDPGTYTQAGADGWVGITIVVRPSVGAPADINIYAYDLLQRMKRR